MRMTKRIGEYVYFTAGRFPETLPAECESNDVRTILRCLATYEDIGLEPEEIISLIHDGGISIAMRRRESEAENERLKSELATALEDLKNNWLCAACANRKAGREWMNCPLQSITTAPEESCTCSNFEWHGTQNKF